MLYTTKPKNFNPSFSSVGCFIDYENSILLLHRQDYKPQGNTWGLPSGKVDKEESINKGIIREVKEETGIDLSLHSISNVLEVYVRYNSYDFIYNIFYTKLIGEPVVKINPKEHKAYKWVKPKDAFKMELIEDLDACIKLFYK